MATSRGIASRPPSSVEALVEGATSGQPVEADTDAPLDDCPECEGSGVVYFIPDVEETEMRCTVCYGSGKRRT